MKMKISEKLVNHCPYCGEKPRIYNASRRGFFRIECQNRHCKEAPTVISKEAGVTFSVWNSISENSGCNETKNDEETVKQCPLCGENPNMGDVYSPKIFVIYCNNNKCARPQVEITNKSEAFRMWNAISERKPENDN